ncbi:hypothetical protein [Promicromonospora sp. NPDC019610]|uniref:hypothetical protein n=1 Tax=Promicromonospora sp. NPDC019610 TaxID=3364405 RepID=UPI0037A2620D
MNSDVAIGDLSGREGLAGAMGWRIGAAAALVVFMAVLGAVSASAEAESAPGEIVRFSVIGELPREPFAADEFRQVGVTDDAVAQITRGVVPSRSLTLAAPKADPNNPYQIVATWNDNTGKALSMRWGSPSWGWLKVSNKHNLTTAAARTTTKHPESRVVESPSAIRYRTPVHRVECAVGRIGCRIVETRTVRVIANPIRLTDGKAKGVITAYCEGVTWCPNWVKNAVNA